MQRALFARRLPAALLTTAAVFAAHGGPALLTDPRWQAALAVTALAACCAAAIATRLARLVTVASAPDFWTTAAVMLGAQLAGHELLLLAGVHSGAGASGTLALHVAVALVAATLVHAGDTRVYRRLRALAQQLGSLEPLPEYRRRPLAAPATPYLAATAAPRGPPASV